MPEVIDFLLPVLWAVGIGALFILSRRRMDSHPASDRSRLNADLPKPGHATTADLESH